ncbi:MAG TPA: hypothetical protein VJN92_09955 [Candidatus Acidoferrum sp.]|nr:hypothetical protein [Candidatus Acidoferrum sp.]
MPSMYERWCRSDPYDARIRNLAKARKSPRYHLPLPWRSEEESESVRRFVALWLTCRDRNKPSQREWARQLGVSHTWVQKLVKKFTANPAEMYEKMRRYGEPTLAQLSRAREYTQEMRDRGLLRPRRLR